MKKINFNLNLKNLFKKKVKAADLDSAAAWPVHFMRDWKIGVITFAVGLILLSAFAWQVYLSDKIGGGYLAPEPTPAETAAKTIDKSKLQADLLGLQTKQAAGLKLETSQPKLVDPSL